MLYGGEHVLLELTVLFDAVVLQVFSPWLFRFRAQPQKVFLWGDLKLVNAEIGFAQGNCRNNWLDWGKEEKELLCFQ